jgi:hypothetical protein
MDLDYLVYLGFLDYLVDQYHPVDLLDLMGLDVLVDLMDQYHLDHLVDLQHLENL